MSIREVLAANSLVTLTGAGGAGKTRRPKVTWCWRVAGPTMPSRWRRDGTWWQVWWRVLAPQSQQATERKRKVTPMRRSPVKARRRSSSVPRRHSANAWASRDSRCTKPTTTPRLRRLRETLGQSALEAAWAEGAALSIEEAIAYAQRGRGERKRPDTGWGSMTPAEHEVVRLVCEGQANKDIATRLFVSPKTVQAHLSHVYTKLGLSSRVQLVQEAARRGSPGPRSQQTN